MESQNLSDEELIQAGKEYLEKKERDREWQRRYKKSPKGIEYIKRYSKIRSARNVNVFIERELYNELKVISKSKRTSIKEFLNNLLRKYLENRKIKKEVTEDNG